MIETGANFEWFWQPPIGGEPGLIMIDDRHPGPEYPEARFVLDVLDKVLLNVESQIDSHYHLFQFSIFIRDVFKRWHEVEFPYPTVRRFRIVDTTATPRDLAELWDQRDDDDSQRFTPGGMLQ